MRRAAERLHDGRVLGRDVFARGAPEGIGARAAGAPSAEIYDLLKAYTARRSTVVRARYRPPLPRVYALADARHRLLGALPKDQNWRDLAAVLPSNEAFPEPPPRRSVLASAFAAGLELAKEGRAELRQGKLFAPIYVRRSERTPRGATA
jgi:segregation and condensation protein A